MNDFIDPKIVLRELNISEGNFVADLGSGTGAFARALSKRVGPSGRVFAVEIQREILQRMQRDFSSENITNVDGIWGDIEEIGGTKIQDNKCDFVVVANVLFQVSDKISFVKEISRILKHAGSVLVVDWSDSYGGIGPKDTDVIKEEKSKQLFFASGFEMLKSFKAGAHHYGIVLKKK